jgi:hypothetical protein
MTIIRNDPIELLRAIKLLTHAPSRAQYPLIDWMHGMRRFLTIKQEPEEALSDFYKRFTHEYDGFKAQFGTKVFHEATEKLSEYAVATTVGQFEEGYARCICKRFTVAQLRQK